MEVYQVVFNIRFTIVSKLNIFIIKST